jgi:N-methylhydantoinase A/oxoprolinase/acetone carboxylase beta subunit
VIQRVADCRYAGQGYELRVDCPSGTIDKAWTQRVTGDFHDAHEREYSRRFEGSDIEIPNVRVRGVGLMPALAMPEIEKNEAVAPDALRQERPAWFFVDGELREVPTRFYAREALRAGNRIEGPAVINQYDSTTVVPPGLVSEIDAFGNIVIWIDASARGGLAGTAGVAVA